jgi:hypothetical protein
MKYLKYILFFIIFSLFTSCIWREDMYNLSKKISEGNDDPAVASPDELSVIDAEATLNTSVHVYFSTDVDLSTAENRINYLIPGLSIISAIRDTADFSIVILTTVPQSVLDYTLTVTSVTDVEGNPIGTKNYKAFPGDALPYIQSVSSSSNTEVVVYFSEDVEQTSAENAFNYSIPGLLVDSAVRDTVDYKKITLVTGQQGGGTNYTLTVSDVADLNGNTIGSPDSMGFVGTGVADTIAPTVLSAARVDSDTVEVTFSEPVDLATSEAAGNYTIEDNDMNPVSVTAAVRQTDTSKVRVNISGKFSRSLYNITVSSNIRDLNNNQLEGPPNNSASFAGEATYITNAVAISNTEVKVYFSNDLDQTGAEITANYSITGLTVTGATRDSVDSSIVDLTTSSQADANYTLNVTGVIDPDSISFPGDALPYIQSVSSSSNTEVVVYFSEDVEQTSAENAFNYSIPGLLVDSAARDTVDYKKITLVTGQQGGGTNYTLTVSDVADLNGNTIGSPDSMGFVGTGVTDIVSAVATSNTSVRVYFSGDVEQSSAETITNYSIPGLNITGAVRDLVDFTIVDLKTSSHEDINYTLNVTGFINPDSISFAGDVPPYIQSVCSYSNTEAVVYFSENVGQTSAENTFNYSIPGLLVNSAVRDSADYSKITLGTESQGDGTDYTLSIINITDLNGNSIITPAAMVFTGTGNPDNTAPRVLSGKLVDSNTVEVQFSEPVDLSSSATTGNYTIKDNIGNTLSVTLASRQSDISKVRLDIAGVFSECLYTLKANTGLMDVSFNSVAGPPYNTVSFAGLGTIPKSVNDGPVLVDPINEGSNNFGMLTRYKGRIYIGPADSDNAVFRLKPDGSDPEIVTLRFNEGGSSTISLDPGPDGEDGIDYISGGTIYGTEYLFIGPSKSDGDLCYVYYTTDSGNTLNFISMNLSAVLGGNTKGVSSIIVFNDNLYIGYPDSGGNRPYINRVMNILQNPVEGPDVIDLEADQMPSIGKDGKPTNNGASIVGIDSFCIYDNRIYAANGGKQDIYKDGGIVKSTTNTPLDYKNYPEDWADSTPFASAEWYNSPLDNRFSKELTLLNKLIPADKAFPAMTVFNNRLYFIRNTTGSAGGPQLWKYDGTIWSLVADNGSGLTDMGNINNLSITLLIVNGDRLYIGYDNKLDGIQLWRTASGITDPAVEGDFEPVSVDGFGDPVNNQILYNCLSISDGGNDYLWLLTGNSGGSIKVYRTAN